MTKKQLIEKGKIVKDTLASLYPDAVCSLDYDGDPWKLLIMSRLSAQCTDKRVNIVSEGLFNAFPTANKMANANLSDVEELIKSCGLYHSKTKSIIEMSKIIDEDYNGIVPDTMEELLSLPGVGRKIANLMLGDIYHKGGIVADTHCIRICGRLGFYPEDKKDPVFTEKTMDSIIDKKDQTDFCHRIVWFGRDICTAKNPLCDECPLKDQCKHRKGK